MSEYPNLDRAAQDAKKDAKEALEKAERIYPGNAFVKTLRERLGKRGHLTPAEMSALGKVRPNTPARREPYGPERFSMARHETEEAMKRDGVMIDRYGLDAPPPREPSFLQRNDWRAARAYIGEMIGWGSRPGRILEDPFTDDPMGDLAMSSLDDPGYSPEDYH